MFLRAATGPGWRSLDSSEEDAAWLEEKLGGGGLLYLLMKSLRLSTWRRKERAGWAVDFVGVVDEASVEEGAGGSPSGL